MMTADPVRRTLEIEDVTNRYGIHPISGWLVPLCARLGIPPNAVSVAGMGCGLLAGVAYAHYRDPWAALGGFLLMLAWHVLDGADGQLARLTNAQSQTGKILDGICDYVTFTAVYLGLALVLGRQHGAWVWGLVALSGACHAVQSAIYEVQRQEYNHWGHGRPSAALPERALPARPGAGDWLHAAYLWVQLRSVGLTGAPRRRLEAALQQDPGHAAAIRSSYRETFAPAVRRWSVLSANYRTLGLFGCALLQRPLLYFSIEVVVLNAILAVLLHRQHRRIRTFLEDQGSALDPPRAAGPWNPAR